MANPSNVYLDYAASTPVAQEVLEVMLPFFTQNFGNPSSVHFFGQQAEAAVDEARQTIAELLHARPDEIVFTSGGSESDNLALKGAAFAERERRGANHLLISPVEHPAVIRTARQLANHFDFSLDYLPVDEFGRVDPADVAAGLKRETAIVSVVYANNEIGTINPISEIGEICRDREIPFHTDAVQAAAHLQMDVQRDCVDFLSIGAHKFYGPKGVGALYVRRGTRLLPMNSGGKQENGLRAGTHNVPYIVGLARAFQFAQLDSGPQSKKMTEMRDWLIGQVLEMVPKARLTGHPVERLPNHASFVFEGIDGNQLVNNLDIAGYACSSGSACKVGAPEPSDVLLAIGLSSSWALGSLRVTLGRQTSKEDLESFVSILPKMIDHSRKRL